MATLYIELVHEETEEVVAVTGPINADDEKEIARIADIADRLGLTWGFCDPLDHPNIKITPPLAVFK